MPMPVILTDPADWQAVRSYTGETAFALTDADIQSLAYLPAAEAFITQRLNAQTGIGVSVPTVAQTIAGTSPAVAADVTFLKNAVIYRIAYLYAIRKAVQSNSTVTAGPVTFGQGESKDWKGIADTALVQADLSLGSITGFKRWRTL